MDFPPPGDPRVTKQGHRPYICIGYTVLSRVPSWALCRWQSPHVVRLLSVPSPLRSCENLAACSCSFSTSGFSLLPFPADLPSPSFKPRLPLGLVPSASSASPLILSWSSDRLLLWRLPPHAQSPPITVRPSTGNLASRFLTSSASVTFAPLIFLTVFRSCLG